MIFQSTSCQLKDVRNWINDGSSIPDWVRIQMLSEPASNGTFLITTPIGAARVHRGDVVIEHQSQLWSRAPDEVPQLMDGFGAEAALPIAAIGPGKDAQFGTKSKAGKGRQRGANVKLASVHQSERCQVSNGSTPPN